MYEDKTLVCKECGSEFVFSQQANRNILPKKVCRTNLKDARLAVMQRKIQAEAKEPSIQAYVLPAVKKLKFPFEPRERQTCLLQRLLCKT